MTETPLKDLSIQAKSHVGDQIWRMATSMVLCQRGILPSNNNAWGILQNACVQTALGMREGLIKVNTTSPAVLMALSEKFEEYLFELMLKDGADTALAWGMQVLIRHVNFEGLIFCSQDLRGEKIQGSWTITPADGGMYIATKAVPFIQLAGYGDTMDSAVRNAAILYYLGLNIWASHVGSTTPPASLPEKSGFVVTSLSLFELAGLIPEVPPAAYANWAMWYVANGLTIEIAKPLAQSGKHPREIVRLVANGGANAIRQNGCRIEGIGVQRSRAIRDWVTQLAANPEELVKWK